MPRIKQETVYQFEELSDQAKERAREWYRQASAEAQDFASFGAESVIEDALRMAEIIGLHIRTRPVKLMNGSTRQDPDIKWSVGGNDSGVAFSGSYSYAKYSMQKLTKEVPVLPGAYDNHGPRTANATLHDIAQRLVDVQRHNFYQIQASISDYPRGFSMGIEIERVDGRDMAPADVETVGEAIRDFASWIEDGLTKEWEYQQSDEYIDENIKANEYEFDEEGRRA